MENKFYTPKIEEFHIGFEYERYIAANEFTKGHGWMKIKFPDPFTGSAMEDIERTLNDIRVKYLDKEDIESFGFKLSAEYGDYIEFNDNLKSFNPRSNKILYNTRSKNMDIQWFAFEDESTMPLFSGKIKNKSELKKLLIQLGIINE